MRKYSERNGLNPFSHTIKTTSY